MIHFKEYSGDIWDLHSYHIVIPINLQGVCGRGLAYQAKEKFPGMQEWLKEICKDWNWQEGLPRYFSKYKDTKYSLFMFPVKYTWRERADLFLIKQSGYALVNSVLRNHYSHIALPRVGCGFGELAWASVRCILNRSLLDIKERVTIVNPEKNLIIKYPKAFKKGIRQDRLSA